MKYTKLRKRYRWEPMEFDSKDILLMIENDHCMEFVFSYHGQMHWIGVCSESRYPLPYTEFFNHIYYIDDQEFSSFQEFKLNAMIDGQLFAELKNKLDVIDTLEGHPKRYYSDLMDLKKRMNKQ